jgi:hypothetical protein
MNRYPNEQIMEQSFERCELRELLDLYMHEARDFSNALSSGATWEVLREKRSRIKEISSFINRKYSEQYSSAQRRRDTPPHGD